MSAPSPCKGVRVVRGVLWTRADLARFLVREGGRSIADAARTSGLTQEQARRASRKDGPRHPALTP